MSIEVELNLRVPSLTVRSPDKSDTRINNESVRFSKRIVVPAVPKTGDRLSVSTRAGEPFECSVIRTDWHEGKNLFVVSCRYGRRSITSAEYDALVSDPDWATIQLP